mmetsp:Transcript_2212/g.6129  ORF Transcript_2212/g.6129 Transcript_2212/m.6129 type:complete len:285 (-) Transcript_2212:49-903(-)
MREMRMSDKGNVIVIGIGGITCSGKSTFCKLLDISLSSQGFVTATVALDDYYHRPTEIPHTTVSTTEFENWDCLEALNFSAFGTQIQTSRVCLAEAAAASRTRGVLLVEGFYVFAAPVHYDLRVILSCPLGTIRQRRWDRDEWLRQGDNICYFDHVVIPQYRRHLETMVQSCPSLPDIQCAFQDALSDLTHSLHASSPHANSYHSASPHTNSCRTTCTSHTAVMTSERSGEGMPRENCTLPSPYEGPIVTSCCGLTVFARLLKDSSMESSNLCSVITHSIHGFV